MGEPGAGDVDMGGIGMIDRQQNPLLLHRGGEIDRLADAAIGDQLAQRRAGLDRLAGEFERRARALDEPAFAAGGDDQRALAFLVGDLGQSHLPLPRRGDSGLVGSRVNMTSAARQSREAQADGAE